MSVPVDYEAASHSKSKLFSPTARKKAKIAFFGIFGIQNLGNECTLQAILHNVRNRLPAAEMYGICYAPDDTSRRHNLDAVAVSEQNWDGVVRRSGLARLLRIFRRIPGELKDWFKAINTLRGTDLVIMSGNRYRSPFLGD